MVVLQNQLARLSAFELDWCVRLQHRSSRPLLRGLFVVVSRLGNGVFWYVLMLWLLIGYGWQAVPAVGHMLLSGLLGLLAYKGLKSKTTRLRPYVSHCGIEALVAPLDEYSFPSGHTLHAVGFTTIAVYFFPGLAWLLLPFTVLIALSRPILGLHYPSDVVVGAILGFGIALSVLWFFSIY